MKDQNRPRCPACESGLDIWASPFDVVYAACMKCGWEWHE